MSSKHELEVLRLNMTVNSLSNYPDEQKDLNVREIMRDAARLPMHLRCQVLSTLVKRLANLT